MNGLMLMLSKLGEPGDPGQSGKDGLPGEILNRYAKHMNEYVNLAIVAI
jgi:hypothetical protein